MFLLSNVQGTFRYRRSRWKNVKSVRLKKIKDKLKLKGVNKNVTLLVVKQLRRATARTGELDPWLGNFHRP